MMDFFLKDKPEKLMTDLKVFFNAQNKWMRNQIEKNIPSDPLWRHVAMVTAQFDGLVDGYKSTSSQVVCENSLLSFKAFIFLYLHHAVCLINISCYRCYTPSETRQPD